MAPRDHPALQRGAQVEIHAVQTDHSPMAATKVRHEDEGHSHNQQGTNDPTSALGQGGACQRCNHEAAPREEGHDITQDSTGHRQPQTKRVAQIQPHH
jgi:hypothetical protein